MSYSTDIPTTPGVYWMRVPDIADARLVWKFTAGALVIQHDGNCYMHSQQAFNLWCRHFFPTFAGPLPTAESFDAPEQAP